ncbi:hypothetical protein M432DRAFT_587350 [Thermoascus aurantiacus ATCC 26904]
MCEQRSHQLNDTGKGRSLRASFMKLFTTSKMGLGIKSTGAGDRDDKMQNDFRREMIQVYGSLHKTEGWIWCPVLGDWCHKNDTRAAHQFAYRHGQDTMDAIFGKTKTPELFSPRNGLTTPKYIEDTFDSGKLVIVPDLPNRPTSTEPRPGSEKNPVNIRIHPHTPLRWRDLDNKRLEFLTAFRPAARYLYFHYRMQVLRRAWNQNPGDGASHILRDEMGNPFWGTPGRYLPRNMLMAFVEELGHNHQDLLQGASCRSGDPNLLLEVASSQVKARRHKVQNESEDDNSEDES